MRYLNTAEVATFIEMPAQGLDFTVTPSFIKLVRVDPKHVFDIMVKAVKYCQKRLGGEILDANFKPFIERDRKEDLKLLVAEMESSGVIPSLFLIHIP